MINILKKVLKTGVVTRSNPFTEAPEKYRGKILVDTHLCHGCKSCVDICPAHAIFSEEKDQDSFKLIFDYTKCIYCGVCAEVCPTDALSQSNQMQKSTRDKRDLLEEFLVTNKEVGE